MPSKCNRVCGCGHSVPSGQLCACQRRRKQERDRQLDRPGARARGYSTAWQKARKTHLERNPRCVRCGGKATVVNHKQPHRGDDKLFWDKTNWESVCKPCHDGPIQSEEKGGGVRSFTE